MPMIYTCLDHPEWRGDHLSVAFDHVDTDHPHGENWMDLRSRGVMGVEFETQVIAQGNEMQRIGGCRSCGTVSDLDRDGYCRLHGRGGS